MQHQSLKALSHFSSKSIILNKICHFSGNPKALQKKVPAICFAPNTLMHTVINSCFAISTIIANILVYKERDKLGPLRDKVLDSRGFTEFTTMNLKRKRILPGRLDFANNCFHVFVTSQQVKFVSLLLQTYIIFTDSAADPVQRLLAK